MLFLLTPAQGHLLKWADTEDGCNRDATPVENPNEGEYKEEMNLEKRTSRGEYIERYWQPAVMEMRWSGVPASVTLAQGILESESGNSDLARIANNHFGIICTQDHAAGDHCVWHLDHGHWRRFLRFNEAAASFRCHSLVLVKSPRYRALLKLEPGDIEGWCKGLQYRGYAESKNYATTLLSIIKANDLTRFDD